MVLTYVYLAMLLPEEHAGFAWTPGHINTEIVVMCLQSRCCSRRETFSRSSASSTSVEVLSLCAPRDSIFCDLLQNYNPEFELNILSIFLGISKAKMSNYIPSSSQQATIDVLW